MSRSFVSSVGSYKTALSYKAALSCKAALCAFTLSVAALGVAPVAHAQTIIPAANRITANDGAASDNFGVSVAISGNIALVGANFDDNGASGNQGAAFLFNATNGVQTAKLLASDGAANDSFGISVAISGNIALVGASGGDGANINQGAAYLFNATTGVQTAKLLANDGAASDNFGRTVAISGNTAIVGATFANITGQPFGGTDRGAAYLFNATTGEQTGKLFANGPDLGELEEFGNAVALSGNTALVGAWQDDLSQLDGVDHGSAFLFNTTTGAQTFKLTASDAANGDRFGNSVAVSGNFALVGSVFADNGTNTNQGAAYLFNVTTGAQLFKFTASDGAANDNFGQSVAISGTIALVGARGANVSQGSVYAFNVLTGLQIDKFSSADGATGDGFGSSVALDGNNALIGANGDDITVGGNTNINQGSAYRITVVPEPGSVALLLLPVATALLAVRRTRRK